PPCSPTRRSSDLPRRRRPVPRRPIPRRRSQANRYRLPPYQLSLPRAVLTPRNTVRDRPRAVGSEPRLQRVPRAGCLTTRSTIPLGPIPERQACPPALRSVARAAEIRHLPQRRVPRDAPIVLLGKSTEFLSNAFLIYDQLHRPSANQDRCHKLTRSGEEA